MTGEMHNPVKFLSLLPLLPAEKKFARCLAEGKSCIIGDGELPEKDIESGEGANVVRSEVIRFFAYGGNEKNPVSGPIIHLHGAWISGDLVLAHARIPYALIFSNCHFVASMAMINTECAALYLSGSRFAEGLQSSGLTTKGTVYLGGGFSAEGEVQLLHANIGGNLNCEGGKFHNSGGKALFADGLTTQGTVSLSEGFSAEGAVRLLGANIGGDLSCEGGKFYNPGGDALCVDKSTVKSDVNLSRGFSAKGKVGLVSVRIGRNLSCEDGKLHNSGGNALLADGLMTKDSVILRGGFSAEGEVRLLGASIGGSLDCEGGKFHNPDGYALSADGLIAKGSVNLRGDFSAEGEVRLLHASIGGNLDCEDGRFHSPDGYALSADSLTTKGNVHLKGKFFAKGAVRLLGANIDGNLDCQNGKFHNPEGDALSADGLMTQGNISLSEGFFAKGKVRLLHASVGGNLDCENGKFHNPDGDALLADGLTTKGSVNLRGGFSTEGAVRLVSANIGINLDCGNGKFHSSDGYALFADSLTTKGNVYLNKKFSAKGEVRLSGANIGGNLSCLDGEFHNPNGDALVVDGLTTKGTVYLCGDFFAEGEVRLLGVNIGGHLSCVGGKFDNAKGYALNVDGGNISGGLFWRNITCEGIVHLAYARADVLVDDSDSWESCKVNLDGFTYNRFANHADIESRLRWLDNRLDGIRFSPLPYEQAAKVLFGMGHVRDAREILLEKERLQTKEEKMHWLRKAGRRLWDVFAGYGYRLRYTAVWMVVLVAFGAIIFGVADLYGNIVPTHPVVALSEGYKEQIAPNGDLRPTQAVTAEYPAFNPFMFSLDVFTPSAVLFHQEDSWGPRAGGEVWWIMLLLVLAFLWVIFAFCFLWFLVIVQWSRSEIFEGRGILLYSLGAGVIVVIAGLVLLYVGFLNILWLLTLWYWFEVAMGWILTSMLLLSITGLLRPRQSSSERD